MENPYSLSKLHNEFLEEEKEDAERFVFLYAIGCVAIIAFFIGITVGYFIH